jgi:hypothetical protein
MKTKFSPIERIGLVTGLVTSLALTAYFMIMKAFGLEQILELRFFNFIIISVGICYAINKLKKELHAEEFYLQGWAVGMYTSAVSVLPFATFMAFYITYFDIPLIHQIKQQMNLQMVNGITIFAAIFMEGMASSVAITLAAMQYFKSPGDVKSEKHYKKVGEGFN